MGSLCTVMTLKRDHVFIMNVSIQTLNHSATGLQHRIWLYFFFYCIKGNFKSLRYWCVLLIATLQMDLDCLNSFLFTFLCSERGASFVPGLIPYLFSVSNSLLPLWEVYLKSLPPFLLGNKVNSIKMSKGSKLSRLRLPEPTPCPVTVLWFPVSLSPTF